MASKAIGLLKLFIIFASAPKVDKKQKNKKYDFGCATVCCRYF